MNSPSNADRRSRRTWRTGLPPFDGRASNAVSSASAGSTVFIR